MADNENAVVVKEIRDRTEAEIASLLDGKLEDLHKAKFKHALGQLRETHLLGSLKRDIARLNTVLRERTQKGQG